MILFSAQSFRSRTPRSATSIITHAPLCTTSSLYPLLSILYLVPAAHILQTNSRIIRHTFACTITHMSYEVSDAADELVLRHLVCRLHLIFVFFFFFFLLRIHNLSLFFFFFNDPAPPKISPLPLPAPLPIPRRAPQRRGRAAARRRAAWRHRAPRGRGRRP